MGKEILEYKISEPRTGTHLISKGFKREHKIVSRLVEKYKSDFEDLGKLEVRKVKTNGRPAIEFFINYNQLLLLISLMRGSKEISRIKSQVIKSSSIVKAIDFLNSFDIDNINVRFVYAMQDSEGNIKIGISNDPDRRLKEISANNASPVKLIMVRDASGEGYSDEAILHYNAKQFRIHSEWFKNEAKEVIK